MRKPDPAVKRIASKLRALLPSNYPRAGNRSKLGNQSPVITMKAATHETVQFNPARNNGYRIAYFVPADYFKFHYQPE
jgi:hypothetical protein